VFAYQYPTFETLLVGSGIMEKDVKKAHGDELETRHSTQFIKA